MGAGVGYGGYASLAGLAGGEMLTPEYRTTIERRLGARTWLGLNASFVYTSDEEPVSSSDPDAREKLTLKTTSLGVLLGARQVVARSVVDFSLFGGVFLLHRSTAGDLRAGESVSAYQEPGDSSSALGALLGFALERELIDDLALRLSIEVASVRLSRTKYVAHEDDGSERTVKLDWRQFNLALAPALQLHFYF